MYVGRYAVMLGSVVRSAWGKAKAGAQYSFSKVSIWDMARARVQHSSSQVLHHTVKPSCKFCMPSSTSSGGKLILHNLCLI